MKVSDAAVCLDCDEVFDTEAIDCCPSCGGLSFVYLGRYFPSLDNERTAQGTFRGNQGHS